MRILVANDDGIDAPGIEMLAKLALRISDDVWVAAPKTQCSAMSHRMTLGPIRVTEEPDFPVEGVKAYSIGGTPGDCVKIGMHYLMKDQLPDIVFSGINKGYNSGIDIMYSGTVAAAMESCTRGIPSYAFSLQTHAPFEVVETWFDRVWEEVSVKPLSQGEMWNINFPGCSGEEVQGIRWDWKPSLTEYYSTGYFVEEKINDHDCYLAMELAEERHPDEHSDMRALLDNYISITKLRSVVF